MYKMKTVKEWAEEAGINLLNYDGFVTAYRTISNNNREGFNNSQSIRFREAGYLYCTREAFLSGLDYCTMYNPKKEDLRKISEVLPELSERYTNINIFFLANELRDNYHDNEQIKEKLGEIYKLICDEKEYREKGIVLNGNKERKLEDINRRYDKEENKILRNRYAEKYNQTTVEGVEDVVLNEITSDIQNMMQDRKVNQMQLFDTLRKIDFVHGLKYDSARGRNTFDISNPEGVKQNLDSFAYAPILDKFGKDEVAKTYRFIGPDTIESGIMYFGPKVKVTMPVSNEMADKIDKNLAEQEKTNDNNNSTMKALQNIDQDVQPEERKSLITRIRDFWKKIASNIKGKNNKDER